MALAPTSAYVHVPFCRHRCGYCNFTVSVSADSQAEMYLLALQQELNCIDDIYPVDTLFFGGGTPTHLTVAQLEQLFQTVYERFPPRADAEITIEANPEDIDPNVCNVLKEWGVNRVSLGVQSFSPNKLRQLERYHTAATVDRAVKNLRGFCDNLSLDLIFGAPQETVPEWQRDVESALLRDPQHLSTYGLTYERGTTFWGRRLRGDLPTNDESMERQMFETSIDMLQLRGWNHYEVSNFSQPGFLCRHNQVYWRGEEYFAVGPGAARYVNTQRETNHRSTSTYIKRILSGVSAVQESERLSESERLRERIVLRLRMMEGIPIAKFESQFDCQLATVLGSTLEEFQRRGWWEICDGHLRLTREGLMISDALWPYVLAPQT
ncbi:MAG: radical SAM family heme chaperone HemW [Planctomycetota bacterium]|nr:radical SAM family heme chaperone HemW [Planctomycetota bacterium]MDA1179238.1 radical SAM family heme chaperone HemW [Planctomycetota bacterium]